MVYAKYGEFIVGKNSSSRGRSLKRYKNSISCSKNCLRSYSGSVSLRRVKSGCTSKLAFSGKLDIIHRG